MDKKLKLLFFSGLLLAACSEEEQIVPPASEEPAEPTVVDMPESVAWPLEPLQFYAGGEAQPKINQDIAENWSKYKEVDIWDRTFERKEPKTWAVPAPWDFDCFGTTHNRPEAKKGWIMLFHTLNGSLSGNIQMVCFYNIFSGYLCFYPWIPIDYTRYYSSSPTWRYEFSSNDNALADLPSYYSMTGNEVCENVKTDFYIRISGNGYSDTWNETSMRVGRYTPDRRVYPDYLVISNWTFNKRQYNYCINYIPGTGSRIKNPCLYSWHRELKWDMKDVITVNKDRPQDKDLIYPSGFLGYKNYLQKTTDVPKDLIADTSNDCIMPVKVNLKDLPGAKYFGVWTIKENPKVYWNMSTLYNENKEASDAETRALRVYYPTFEKVEADVVFNPEIEEYITDYKVDYKVVNIVEGELKDEAYNVAGITAGAYIGSDPDRKYYHLANDYDHADIKIPASWPTEDKYYFHWAFPENYTTAVKLTLTYNVNYMGTKMSFTEMRTYRANNIDVSKETVFVNE